MTDPGQEQLVEAAIRGDREALRLLWHTHRRWVAAVLLAHKPRHAELDDLLQEVAMSVVAKIGGLREAGAFKPWLRAVALNAAKTAARKRASGTNRVLRVLGVTEREEDQAAAEPGEHPVAVAEEGRRLMALAATLPDGYREPLLMRCLNGMGYTEIGQVMGLPETTIETRIARGRRMLRELAEQSGVDAGGEGAQAAVGARRSGGWRGGENERKQVSHGQH